MTACFPQDSEQAAAEAILDGEYGYHDRCCKRQDHREFLLKSVPASLKMVYPKATMTVKAAKQIGISFGD